MTPQIAIPPSVSWAQRSACVFLTFNVECDKPDLVMDKNKISFSGVCGPDQAQYQVDIPLYAEIDPDNSTFINKGRFIDVVLSKAKTDEPFWPTLTSDKKKHHWLKVDFERWQDEDDSGEECDDMSDMFNSKLGNFGEENEKDEFSSGDEEDLPDLE